MSKVVTIIGLSRSSLAGADLKAEDGELWGLNMANKMREFRGAKWTRWFEMHAVDYLRRFQRARWRWCKQLKIPCYMLERHDEIPCSKAYPRKDINAYLRKRFDSEPDYFTSSFSYMIALAMYEGFAEIRLYGVDLMDAVELALERSGAEYLIGLARGSGIRVVLSRASPMLYTRWPYGYDEPRMLLAQAKKETKRLGAALALLSGGVRTDNTMEEIRNSKGHYIWMRNYARRGMLLKKNGSVN